MQGRFTKSADIFRFVDSLPKVSQVKAIFCKLNLKASKFMLTVPPETMDPSGCGKTSSLPRAPTSRPPRVKICSTAVKTSATAIKYILRQNRRGNTSGK